MKPVLNHPDYSVTKDGRVWSKARPHVLGGWLKPMPNTKGHLFIHFYKRGKKYKQYIHRLVLESFVGPCPEGMECRHLNGNPADNKLGNLKWGTQIENMADRTKHGTGNQGERHGMAKLTEEQVRLIFNSYYDGGCTQQKLVDYFGVSKTTIGDIVHKKTWRHIWVTT